MSLTTLLNIFLCWHAIYISVCEIDYDEKNKRWGVVCRIFNNDLEDAIYNYSGSRISLRTTEEVEKGSQEIMNYLREKLKLYGRINERLPLKWEEGIADNDLVRIWLSCPASDIDRIENDLLTELFHAQENIVSVKKSGETRFFRFNAGTKAHNVTR